MGRSESNKTLAEVERIDPPRRRFTVEFAVGIFTLLGVAAAGVLSVGLGGEQLFSAGQTDVIAEFDNISGLSKGASVEIAGVPIGKVADIRLRESFAMVTLRLNRGVQLFDDDIAAIRTKGIIGDRYVKISRGGSDIVVPPGGKLSEKSESVVDIEDLIGKIVHSLTGEKEDKKEEKKEPEQPKNSKT